MANLGDHFIANTPKGKEALEHYRKCIAGGDEKTKAAFCTSSMFDIPMDWAVRIVDEEGECAH